MVNDFIEITPAIDDLPSGEGYEIWIKQSYKKREEEIVIHIVTATGYAPSQKMIGMRQISFQIKPCTTMDDIIQLLPIIKKRFAIDGFQIAIDRNNLVATILFEWYDRKENKLIHFYEWRQIRLSVFLILSLDLPYTRYRNLFHKHFVEEMYFRNTKVFDNAVRWLVNAKAGKENFNIIYHALKFSENICINNGKY